MTILPLGDAALTIRVREDFHSDPEGCCRAVRQVLGVLRSACLPGVREVTPAFASVSVFYEPAEKNGFEELAEKIGALLETLPDSADGEGRTVEIPVCYAEEFGPDLARVAAAASLTAREVIVAHTSSSYRVGCIGFAPGFPYLLGLPRVLATPRRGTPRVQVAAGSVAIGGAQTGIYPQVSPGGWNVIGRTPRRLFAVQRHPLALLAMGDEVRFRAITRAEFEAFEN